jgi:protein O-GlcNAc transferase
MAPNLIGRLWQQLRQSAAQPALWLELARCYAGCGLPWQAAYAARQALRLDESLLPQLQALALGAWQDTTAGDALLGRRSLTEAATLAERFAGSLQQFPGDWLTALYLARLREMKALPLGDALSQAQALEPISGESLHWLGVWRLNAGDAQGAVAALSGLLDIRPVRFGSMMYLGEALLRVGNTAAAEKAFARASLSSNPDFLLDLSARVYAHNYWQEAIDVLNKALGLRTDSVPIMLALAKIYWEIYELSTAQAVCRQVLALQPKNQDAAFMLAALPGRMGNAAAHLAAVQAEYAALGDPTSRLASSIAMASLYSDELAPAEVADLHRRLCAPIEAAVVQAADFANPRSADRRLRIGYVTGDFHRQHPVNIFMLPVLLRHNHDQFDIYVYHTGTMFDEYTRQAKACADHWLEAAALDDAALQQAIVADGVDILVDLAGHTSSHRLGVFAMRAAPVQATFLGYPHSTGLSSIDWLLGDAIVSPAEQGQLFSEGIAQLPGSVFCWAPVDEYSLPPARPPAAPVVFGSFNNAMKLSPKTIALWSRVLRAVPDAQLLLKAPSLRDAAVQVRFAGLFAAQGIAPERLILRGPSGLAEMMQEYGDMDIALDPTPYNGGTTTLQALWMGVPVVALEGGNFVGRMGASFMATLGQPDWMADDEDAYVAAAVALAGDTATLRGQRAQLREQMAASPLCDITRYVTHFEALLQRMWALYCAAGNQPAGGGVPRLITAAETLTRTVHKNP